MKNSSKKLRIGINGFGRIGRAVCRQLLQAGTHEIVAINDINPDAKNLAYLLKYDTTYGKLDLDVQSHESSITIGGRQISIFCKKEVNHVPWSELNVDVLVESTGVKLNEDLAKSLASSKMKVILTHASSNVDFTLVFGVNHKEYNPAKHHYISTSICDANACAPVLKVLEDNFGIESGFVTTLHPWLSYQNLMDGPSASQAYPGATYSHYPLGRSSVGTLIPKPTTVLTACEQVLPGISSKMQSFSYRVPTNAVSSADLTLTLKKPAKIDAIQNLFLKFQESDSDFYFFKMCDEPLISVDFLQDTVSSILDRRWILLNGDKSLKLILWYDNEWGYAARVTDAIDLVSWKVG